MAHGTTGNLAEQELRQVKSEIRTDKFRKTATTAATAIISGVASLFGNGKLKELEHANEKLQDEVSKREADIKKLQTQIQQMQKQHGPFVSCTQYPEFSFLDLTDEIPKIISE